MPLDICLVCPSIMEGWPSLDRVIDTPAHQATLTWEMEAERLFALIRQAPSFDVMTACNGRRVWINC